MTLLNKATNETAFLSASIYGFAGSGKSFTAACIAIGLHEYIKSKAPIACIDTEGGTDFLLPHFKHNGIEIIRSKSRSFADVLPTIQEAKKAGVKILIVDSCSHLWKELCNAYEVKYNRKQGLQFQDWKNVKGEWGKFMTAVINEPLHIILLGRAGYEYDYIDIDGKKTLVKTKTKMRAEGETEHEPSITLEMERQDIPEEDIAKLARKQKAGLHVKLTGGFSTYLMYVLKDRANFLTGSVFSYPPRPGVMIEPDNPVFTDILPFVKAINIGGTHKGVDAERNSEDMFIGTDNSWTEKQKKKKIFLEEIESELATVFSTKQSDKKEKVALLKDIFGTASWTAIKGMSLQEIEGYHSKIMVRFNPDLLKPQEDATDNDLPEFNNTEEAEYKRLMAADAITPEQVDAFFNLCDPGETIKTDADYQGFWSSEKYSDCVEWIYRQYKD